MAPIAAAVRHAQGWAGGAQDGGRFSRKAAIPSAASAEANSAWDTSVVRAKAASAVDLGDRVHQPLGRGQRRRAAGQQLGHHRRDLGVEVAGGHGPGDQADRGGPGRR